MTKTDVQPRLRIPTECKTDECVQTGPSVQPVHLTGSEECVQPCGGGGQETNVKKTNQVNPSTVEKPSIQVAGRNIRARFSLSKIEGGKFSLKLNNTEQRKLEGVSVDLSGEPDSASSSSYKPTFLNSSTHAKSEIHKGGNETLFFNNIEITKTPKLKTKIEIICGKSNQ